MTSILVNLFLTIFLVNLRWRLISPVSACFLPINRYTENKNRKTGYKETVL